MIDMIVSPLEGAVLLGTEVQEREVAILDAFRIPLAFLETQPTEYSRATATAMLQHHGTRRITKNGG